MNERDVSAIMRGVTPVLRQHFDALASRIVRDAEQAEALRGAEHRAFMAEQREMLADMKRQVEARLTTVKDGRDGIDGKDGPAGRDGIDGKDGSPGVDGRDGVDGAAGIDGKDGEPGKDGRDGIDGTNGTDGKDGADGRDGTDGKDGADGLNGKDGRDGVDGEPGLPGSDGRNGVDGTNGVNGIDGKDGRDGVDGRDGADAYHGEARGLFDPAATYRALDVVSFNGSEWRARHDDPGELPGAGWMLSASKGKRGEPGKEGQTGPAAPGVVASYIDEKTFQHIITLSDGTELKADLIELVRIIRGAQD